MMLVWIVIILSVAWFALWLRSRIVSRRVSGVDARQLLRAHDLENEAVKAEREGKYHDAQRMRLDATWLRIKPDAGTAPSPPVLDPADTHHLMLADVVRQEYARALVDQDNAYHSCTVKPLALLPFPREYIEASLELFTDLARGRRTSALVEGGRISQHELEIVERSLELLATYVDYPPENVPTDPTANLEFARETLHRS